MAAKLQCEICGGKLIGKPGGIFECENCGTEYSTEWAKAKIQEITGTVKVEGTVEVTGKVQVEGGTVQVDNSASKEVLLDRGNMALEDEEWDKAKDLFDQVLNMDSRNAEAYLGMAMAEEKCRNREALRRCYVNSNSTCKRNKMLTRGRQFGNENIRRWFESLDDELRETEEIAQTKQRAQEALKKEEAERQRIIMERKASELRENREKAEAINHLIAVGAKHVVGIIIDGTVVSSGSNVNGQRDLSNWGNIKMVAAGNRFTIGLKSTGQIVASVYKGEPILDHGQCKVTDWSGIVAIAAGGAHTVGVKAVGNVVAVGADREGQCRVKEWNGIVAVSAGSHHTIGLKSDGTVVAAGGNSLHQCEIQTWQNIAMIAAGSFHTVGLTLTGDVLAVGWNKYGQCNVGEWHDIVSISAGQAHTVGLTANGTVVAQGKNENGECNVSDWKNIVSVKAGAGFTVGIKSNGSVVATGLNADGQCDVSNWKLFNSFETIEAERRATAKKTEAERKAAAEKAKAERKASLSNEQSEKEKRKAALEKELPTLTGIFKAGKRREAEAELARINARLAEIEAELEKLG